MGEDPKSDFNLLEKSGFIVWSFVILFALGLPFFTFVVGKTFGFWVFARPKCEGTTVCPVPIAYVGLNWLAIASCAALFGAIGVMISLVLRRKLDNRLFNLSVPKILLVVYSVGSIFAIIMVALFIGDFLQGSLFPSFAKSTSWTELFFRVPDWSKLVIWSFIAGFSERLMPNLFDQLIEKMQIKDNSPSGTK